ncbi:S8 family peptidase [Clostridium felsineum]|uniref:Serine protease AprX n=1 Tax=Clostridium felsineum TaxID=36839 RepID=A0A1S8L5Y3_9CLOT|nr:S8 family serine peptidase [Clostridium felsineum]MCR3757437.1 S8 family serine peptidase [Clostridium felsineum]URZ08653.1 Serine protease AprX [Clostridium felsineum]URZ13683.1 Serine protease AprX [Clostridium felsineum]
MLSLKHKLDPNLKTILDENTYKSIRVIVHCKKFQDRILSRLKSYKSTIFHSVKLNNCISADVSSNAIKRLIEYPEVDYITIDDFCFICASESSSSYTSSLKNSTTFSGRGVCVGIVDTGVYPHYDLKYPMPKIDNFVDLINGLNYPYDDNGHGTFMSGLIAGSGKSSKGDIKGLAYNSKLYMIKAFEKNGRAYTSSVLSALEILINESSEHNIKIICLPFEGFFQNSFLLSMFSQTFKTAADKNIVIVLPSGSNKNTKSSIRSIAALPHCVTVSGINIHSGFKSYTYSASGPLTALEKPNLCAPCTDLNSLNCDDSYISERNDRKIYPRELKKPYTKYTGISCSAAYVSAALALLFEKSPDLSYKDAVSILKTSCNLLKIPKWQQGAGLIDINSLLN